MDNEWVLNQGEEVLWTPCEDHDDPDPDVQVAQGSLWLTWLADALRAGGCKVREEPGWRTRGHGGMISVKGVLVHHTGSAGMPGSRNVVRDGRSDLRGPLAQLTLDPDGTFSVIAAGQSWHPGQGGPLLGVPANNGSPYLIGIEGVSDGQRWTDAQRREYPKGVAALLRHIRAPKAEGWVAGHKEWAPTRKWDPGAWDMNQFRAEVNRHLHGGTQEEDDMDFNTRHKNYYGQEVDFGFQINHMDREINTLRTRLDETANAILELEAAQKARDERIISLLGGDNPKA